MEVDPKKYAIIGYCGAGMTVLHHVLKNRTDTLIVLPPDNSFIVKDKRYTKRPEKPIKGGLANALIRDYVADHFRHEFTYSDDSFIIDQYRLIQDRKCKLSKSRRDKIETEFNRRFEVIKEAE